MKRNKIHKLISKFIIATILGISLFTLIPKNINVNALSQPTKRIVWDLPHSDTYKDVGCEITIDGIRYTEKDISTQISKKVINKLRNSGIEVITTRNENESKDLNSRIAIANKTKSDLYISPHINSAINTAKGVEAFTKGDTTELANNILKDISDKFDTPIRRVEDTPYYNKYIKGNSLLLELGFINGTDIDYLTNNQEEVADIIYQNIMKMYSNDNKIMYKVKVGDKQVGAFRNIDNARKYAKETGGYIVKENNKK